MTLALLTADRNDEPAEAAVFAVPTSPIAERAEPSAVGERYSEARKLNLPALIAACLIPALVAAALLQTGIYAARKAQQPRLVVMNLSPPPPPPPAAETPPSPPKAVVVAPVPLLQVPRSAPPPVITTAPVPQSSAVPIAAPPAPPATVKAGDLGTRMISAVPPRYPVESRRRHEQGTVVLGLTLDPGGNVAAISIVHSSGYSRLDEAALKAVRKWRWAPILRDGQPVMVRGEVEIPFVLRN